MELWFFQFTKLAWLLDHHVWRRKTVGDMWPQVCLGLSWDSSQEEWLWNGVCCRCSVLHSRNIVQYWMYSIHRLYNHVHTGAHFNAVLLTYLIVLYNLCQLNAINYINTNMVCHRNVHPHNSISDITALMTTVYWLIRLIDSIYWFDLLIRFIDSIDSIYWFDWLIRFIDWIYWFAWFQHFLVYIDSIISFARVKVRIRSWRTLRQEQSLITRSHDEIG